MQELEIAFRRNGYDYEQMTRSRSTAIYQQTDPDSGDIWYEVIKITIREENNFKGRVFPRRERYPSSEDWGRLGWTFKDRQNAEAKYQELNDEE